jgi:hypothetical protein
LSVPTSPDTVTLVANYILCRIPRVVRTSTRSATTSCTDQRRQRRRRRDHITYQFQFKTSLRNRNSFLYNAVNSPRPKAQLEPAADLPRPRVENGKSKAIGWDLTVPRSTSEALDA